MLKQVKVGDKVTSTPIQIMVTKIEKSK